MHNPNTLPGCAINYRQVVVNTAYRGEALQQSSFPLVFSQKHGETQAVWVPMLSDHIPLNQTNGEFLQQEVSNENVLMEVYLDTRFRTAERKTKSNRVTCQVLVTTPNVIRRHDVSTMFCILSLPLVKNCISYVTVEFKTSIDSCSRIAVLSGIYVLNGRFKPLENPNPTVF